MGGEHGERERTHVDVEHGGLTLAGWLERPPGQGPHPGLVLVAGSGDMSRDDWGGWPTWAGWAGAATLRYDKPGCGGSPGDWRQQSFADRADEAVAALRTLAAQPGIDPDRVGLLGGSQGGWVSLLAGSKHDEVKFVVSISGPGVSPYEQEAFRIENALRSRGLSEDEVAAGVAYYHEHRGWVRDGVPSAEVLARQQAHTDAAWYEDVCGLLDSEEMISFIGASLDDDPVQWVAGLRCPLLAMFGEADDLVPVARSVEIFERTLAEAGHVDHRVAVFPGANHGLFIAEPDDDVPRHKQLAPGSLDALADWLESVVGAEPRRAFTGQAGAALRDRAR